MTQKGMGVEKARDLEIKASKLHVQARMLLDELEKLQPKWRELLEASEDHDPVDFIMLCYHVQCAVESADHAKQYAINIRLNEEGYNGKIP
jgi:predicted nuclease with TOPRIM domain